VRYYAGTLSKTHAKAGQRNAEFVVDTECLLYEFIDKAIVSICNGFRSCVAVIGGH